MTSRRALPPRQAMERVRALLDRGGGHRFGRARWPGAWRASAPGARWRPSWGPTGSRSPGGAPPRWRRSCGAGCGRWGPSRRPPPRSSSPPPASRFSFGEPASACRAARSGDLWRATVVEDASGLWAVEQGEDFVLRGADGRTALVLCDGGTAGQRRAPADRRRGRGVRHRRAGAGPRRPGRRLTAGAV